MWFMMAAMSPSGVAVLLMVAVVYGGWLCVVGKYACSFCMTLSVTVTVVFGWSRSMGSTEFLGCCECGDACGQSCLFGHGLFGLPVRSYGWLCCCSCLFVEVFVEVQLPEVYAVFHLFGVAVGP